MICFYVFTKNPNLELGEGRGWSKCISFLLRIQIENNKKTRGPRGPESLT